MNVNLLLKGILHTLFKRKTQIFVFFAATMLVVLPLSLITQKTHYQSTSQIRLETGREFVSDLRLDTLGAVNPVVRFDQAEQIGFAVDIIRGRSLAESVIDEIGATTIYPQLAGAGWLDRLLPRALRADGPSEREIQLAAVETLGENIDVEANNQSALITIGVRHDDPEMAARITSALVKAYIDRHLNLRKNTRSDRFFQQQFDTIKTNLQHAEQQLHAIKQRLRISTTLEDERELLISQINKLNTDLSETLSKQRETENRIALLKAQLAQTAKDPAGIGILRERLLELQIKEGELALNYNNDSRTLENLRAEIASLKRKLNELGGNKRYGSTAAGNSTSLYQDLQRELLKSQADQSALVARGQIVQNQLAGLQRRLQQLDAAETDYLALRQQVQVARGANSLYLTKFEERRISEAMDDEKISSISIIEPARVPLEPMKSKLPLLLALGVFVGLVGGIGLTFLLETLNRTIDRREEVEQNLGVPVLASIPEYQSA